MKIALKILATIFFCLIWGSIQRGCQDATRSESGAGYLFVNIFGLVLLVAGIYGIWSYNHEKVENDNNDQETC